MSNSSDFHKIAIIPQPLTAILVAVALLTGRVYWDGLGGLRAVLFSFPKFRPWLLQIRSYDVDELVGSQRLFRTDLLLLIDDVETDMTLQQFRH
jgi:hypothetical protein